MNPGKMYGSQKHQTTREKQLVNNRYEIREKIGTGATGDVFVVEDRESGEKRALKTLREQSDRSRHEFQNEFQLLSEFRHPNLETVFDFGEIQTGPETLRGCLYFTSEYIQGTSWKQINREQDPEQLIPQVVQICRALQFVHARNLVHYDIKPINVMISNTADRPQERVKLVDFGLAEQQTSSGGLSVRGTIHYISPEVIRREPVDGRADLYSLGVTLYELLTGSFPFIDDSSTRIMRAHLNRSVPDLRNSNEDIPECLAKLIPRLLAKRPENRPSSANEVIQKINEWSGEDYKLETRGTIKGYISSPSFVGRQEELDRLKTFWTDLRQGNSGASTVFVKGPSGIGKSRLIKEFRIWAQVNSIPVITAKVDKHAVDSAGFLKDMLKQYIRFVETWEHTGESEWGKLVTYSPYLSTFLPDYEDEGDVGFDSSFVLEDREKEKQRLLDRLGEFFLESLGENGVILVVEDLHWADEQSLKFLEILIRKQAFSYPEKDLFVVGTHRPAQENSKLAHLSNTLKQEQISTDIKLVELDASTTKTFITGMFGPAGEEIAEKVVEIERMGNPLYLSELLKAFVEENVITQQEGTWEIERTQWEQMELPANAGDVIDRRIRDLGEQEKQWLKTLATWRGAISRHEMDLLLDEEQIPEPGLIQALVKRGIVRKEENQHKKIMYRFAHDRIEERVRENMNDSDWKDRNLTMLKSLEASVRERGMREEEYVEKMAQFAWEAGEQEKFQEYGEEAAEIANNRFANDIALDWYRKLFQTGLTEEKETKVRINIADKLSTLGQFEDAMRICDEMLKNQNLGEVNWLRLLEIKVNILQSAGKQEETLQVYREVVERYRGDPPEEPEPLRYYIGHMKHYMYYLSEVINNREKALHLGKDLLELIKKLPDTPRQKEIQCKVKLIMAQIHSFTGQIERGLQLVSDVRPWAENNNHTEIRSLAHNVFGMLHGTRGNIQTSRKHFEMCIELHKSISFKSGIATNIRNLGIIHRYLGNFKQSEKLYKEAHGLFRELKARTEEMRNYNNLSIVYRKLGRYDEALKMAKKSVHLAEELNINVGIANGYNSLGTIESRQGNLDQALELYRKGIQYVGNVNAYERENCLSNNIASIQLEKGNTTEAKETLNSWDLDKLRKNLKSNFLFNVLQRAQIYRYEENYEEALSILERAYQIAKEHSLNEYLLEIRHERAELYLDQGLRNKSMNTHLENLEDIEDGEMKIKILRQQLAVAETCLQVALAEGDLNIMKPNIKNLLNTTRQELNHISHFKLRATHDFLNALYCQIFGKNPPESGDVDTVINRVTKKNHHYLAEMMNRKKDALFSLV